MTMSAPWCERMMSSMPWRSGVPGATRETASRRRPPHPEESLLSAVLSVVIVLRPGERVSNGGPQRRHGHHTESAMRRRLRRGHDVPDTELRALLETALTLRGEPEPARE